MGIWIFANMSTTLILLTECNVFGGGDGSGGGEGGGINGKEAHGSTWDSTFGPDIIYFLGEHGKEKIVPFYDKEAICPLKCPCLLASKSFPALKLNSVTLLPATSISGSLTTNQVFFSFVF